jgi:hypothetical protein
LSIQANDDRIGDISTAAPIVCPLESLLLDQEAKFEVEREVESRRCSLRRGCLLLERLMDGFPT